MENLTGIFCVLSIIISVIAVIVGAIKIKKQKGKFSQFMMDAEAEEHKMNDQGAIVIYKQGLSHLLGLEKGSTELTAKGFGILMEEGKKAVEKINTLYARNGISYSWDEFNGLLAEFTKMSTNKALVDGYGLPKGAGKELYALLKAKLQNCLRSMPEVNTPAGATPFAWASQPAVVSPFAQTSQPAPGAAFIPSADEYAAKNKAANKKKLITWLIVIGAFILVMVLVCMAGALMNTGGG